MARGRENGFVSNSVAVCEIANFNEPDVIVHITVDSGVGLCATDMTIDEVRRLQAVLDEIVEKRAR